MAYFLSNHKSYPYIILNPIFIICLYRLLKLKIVRLLLHREGIAIHSIVINFNLLKNAIETFNTSDFAFETIHNSFIWVWIVQFKFSEFPWNFEPCLFYLISEAPEFLRQRNSFLLLAFLLAHDFFLLLYFNFLVPLLEANVVLVNTFDAVLLASDSINLEFCCVTYIS